MWLEAYCTVNKHVSFRLTPFSRCLQATLLLSVAGTTLPVSTRSNSSSSRALLGKNLILQWCATVSSATLL